MPSIRAIPNFGGTFWSSLIRAVKASTDIPMGSIMTAVAVLETHMLMNPVAIMNPPISWRGLVPTSNTVASAIRRCRFHRCSARASMNPPMNRKMIGFA